jgi:hypothetical protein
MTDDKMGAEFDTERLPMRQRRVGDRGLVLNADPRKWLARPFRSSGMGAARRCSRRCC